MLIFFRKYWLLGFQDYVLLKKGAHSGFYFLQSVAHTPGNIQQLLVGGAIKKSSTKRIPTESYPAWSPHYQRSVGSSSPPLPPFQRAMCCSHTHPGGALLQP